MSRCGLLLAAALLATGGQALPSEHREARGLADWFGWATPAQPEPLARRVQRPVLQRRGGQFVGDDIKESFLRQSQARILSRPKPRRNESPRKKVTQPRPSQINKRKLLMPVIISSYASTSIQGHGNEEHEEKNIIEETKQPKDTKNSAKEDAFREAQAQSKVEETTEADEPKLATQSTTAAPLSTITTTVATTTKESPKETTQEAVLENDESSTEAVETNEVADYDQSPYLPALPDSLDSERILVLGREPDQVADRRSSEASGTYLAGYQQIQTNKKVRFPGDKTGRDGTTREREDRPAPPRQSKPDFYPLGKAPGKASGKKPGKAGSSKPIVPKKKFVPHPLKHLPPSPPPKPVKEVEASSSFFDFLPFWKAGPASPAPAPPRPSRRPAPPGRRVGPTVTQVEQSPPPKDYPAGLQAPLLLKVGSAYPAQDTPSRPIHRASARPAPARIDNRIYTEGEDPFVVLPAASPKPSLPRRGPLPPRRAPPPKPSGRPHASLRPKNTRLGSGPLPMTSQPVIGLPQVPPSRKQSPFISRRPQLPPRVPGPSKAFPPPPRKPLAQRKNLSARKPFPPKSHLPHPKFGPKKPPTPEITLKPNGSNQPAGAIASHLSSLLSSFFSTTVSPARPPAALPSLVEDTEFANVVNGYKASDSTEKAQGETTEKSSIAKPTSKIEYDDDLDTLSAPLPRGAQTTKAPTTTTATTTTTITTTLKPTTTTARTTVRTTATARVTFAPRTYPTTTFIAPIQEIVDNYRSKVHVVPQDHLDSSVYQTLQKDFEQKRNIFEQFVSGGAVTFTEVDKRFTPNKEVYSSDWSIQTGLGQKITPPAQPRSNTNRKLESNLSLDDKVLVYQDLTPSAAPTTTTPTAATKASPAPSTQPSSTVKPYVTREQTVPDKRGSEGGFRPILRPLHSQLSK